MRWLPNRYNLALPLIAVCLCWITGCAGTSGAGDKDLTIQSRSNPGSQPVGGFARGVYRQNDPSSLTILLTDGPEGNPTRAMIVRMFWKPKAAATPLDETATNATVQYIVFNEASTVGIYSGGGFLYPENEVGEQSLVANLWQATMSLADSSEGFDDDLGASILKGRFTARRDDAGTIEAIRQINIAVSEGLGRPRFVGAE